MDVLVSMRNAKVAAGAIAVAAVAVGLVATGAVAASRALSPGEESKAVIDDAAGQLGVEPSALRDALKQALKNRIDEAVQEIFARADRCGAPIAPR